MIQFQALYEEVINYINTNIPQEMVFHQSWHTKEVIQAANAIADAEGVNASEKYVLLTAALIHDVGYAHVSSEHEVYSCKYAEKILPDFGLSESYVSRICDLIKTTRIPQSPFDHLSEILCDADLYYFGDDSYEAKADLLCSELISVGRISSKESWHSIQIDFLDNHRYFTQTAQKNCNIYKFKMLAKLKETWKVRN